jgi:hypothetical protein
MIPISDGRIVSMATWVSFGILAAFAFVLGPRCPYGVVMMANSVSAVMCFRLALFWWSNPL